MLCGKQHKVRVWLDDLLRLGNEQLSVVIQQAIQCLENFGRSKVQLIQHDPITL